MTTILNIPSEDLQLQKLIYTQQRTIDMWLTELTRRQTLKPNKKQFAILKKPHALEY